MLRQFPKCTTSDLPKWRAELLPLLSAIVCPANNCVFPEDYRPKLEVLACMSGVHVRRPPAPARLLAVVEPAQKSGLERHLLANQRAARKSAVKLVSIITQGEYKVRFGAHLAGCPNFHPAGSRSRPSWLRRGHAVGSCSAWHVARPRSSRVK